MHEIDERPDRQTDRQTGTRAPFLVERGIMKQSFSEKHIARQSLIDLTWSWHWSASSAHVLFAVLSDYGKLKLESIHRVQTSANARKKVKHTLSRNFWKSEKLNWPGIQATDQFKKLITSSLVKDLPKPSHIISFESVNNFLPRDAYA